mmetsp:Transcript_28649/g.42407  ORF Transcript_28649/g.42407 Transcript_28649/m.42407 type:complete len:205 (-) Transcript_28649:163-777(-)
MNRFLHPIPMTFGVDSLHDGGVAPVSAFIFACKAIPMTVTRVCILKTRFFREPHQCRGVVIPVIPRFRVIRRPGTHVTGMKIASTNGLVPHARHWIADQSKTFVLALIVRVFFIAQHVGTAGLFHFNFNFSHHAVSLGLFISAVKCGGGLTSVWKLFAHGARDRQVDIFQHKECIAGFIPQIFVGEVVPAVLFQNIIQRHRCPL